AAIGEPPPLGCVEAAAGRSATATASKKIVNRPVCNSSSYGHHRLHFGCRASANQLSDSKFAICRESTRQVMQTGVFNSLWRRKNLMLVIYTAERLAHRRKFSKQSWLDLL